MRNLSDNVKISDRRQSWFLEQLQLSFFVQGSRLLRKAPAAQPLKKIAIAYSGISASQSPAWVAYEQGCSRNMVSMFNSFSSRREAALCRPLFLAMLLLPKLRARPLCRVIFKDQV